MNAPRAVLAVALLFGAFATKAQCPLSTSGWPTEVAIEPNPAAAGVPLQAVLGPAPSVGIFQPTVTPVGSVVTLGGRFQVYGGVGEPPPPAPFVQPIGAFAPGKYVLRIALTDQNGLTPCPVLNVPFVVLGSAAPAQPVPLARATLLALAALLWVAATASRAARSRRCRSR